jgi:hypothetical protein
MIRLVCALIAEHSAVMIVAKPLVLASLEQQQQPQPPEFRK